MTETSHARRRNWLYSSYETSSRLTFYGLELGHRGGDPIKVLPSDIDFPVDIMIPSEELGTMADPLLESSIAGEDAGHDLSVDISSHQHDSPGTVVHVTPASILAPSSDDLPEESEVTTPSPVPVRARREVTGKGTPLLWVQTCKAVLLCYLYLDLWIHYIGRRILHCKWLLLLLLGLLWLWIGNPMVIYTPSQPIPIPTQTSQYRGVSEEQVKGWIEDALRRSQKVKEVITIKEDSGLVGKVDEMERRIANIEERVNQPAPKDERVEILQKEIVGYVEKVRVEIEKLRKEQEADYVRREAMERAVEGSVRGYVKEAELVERERMVGEWISKLEGRVAALEELPPPVIPSLEVTPEMVEDIKRAVATPVQEGRVDWADMGGGGRVIHSESSRPLVHLPSVAIDPYNHLGNCYAFKGEGYVTIRLPAYIKVSGFTVHHIAYDQAQNWKSAPKDIRVKGYVSSNDRKEYELGAFTFDYPRRGAVQYFDVLAEADLVPLRYVRFEFDGNYGAEFTCVYQLQVHGEKASHGLQDKHE